MDNLSISIITKIKVNGFYCNRSLFDYVFYKTEKNHLEKYAHKEINFNLISYVAIRRDLFSQVAIVKIESVSTCV